MTWRDETVLAVRQLIDAPTARAVLIKARKQATNAPPGWRILILSTGIEMALEKMEDEK